MNQRLSLSFILSLKTALYLSVYLSMARVCPGLRAQVWDRPTHSSYIAISRTDKLVWVVNPSENTVSVLRTDTHQVLATIPVGKDPRSVALTPDNQFVYVANAGENSVTVLRILASAWVEFQADVQGHITTGAE